MTIDKTNYPTIQVSEARRQIQEAILQESQNQPDLKVGTLIALGNKTYLVIEDKEQS